MNNESWLVIFEGPDKTGKSSIIDCFRKMTDYKHTVIDRAFISSAVYNIKFNRKYDSLYYIEQLKQISSKVKVLIVLCVANVDVIKDRIKKSPIKNEYISCNDDKKLTKEIEEDLGRFKTLTEFCKSWCDTLIIDTSYSSIDKSAKDIFNYIENGSRYLEKYIMGKGNYYDIEKII